MYTHRTEIKYQALHASLQAWRNLRAETPLRRPRECREIACGHRGAMHSGAPVASSMAHEEGRRRFTLKLEVRAIRTGRRFPARALVYARASVPAQMVNAGAQSLTVRTAPAVDVIRSSESSLPQSTKSQSFDADAYELANAVNQSEQMLAELWVKDPYTYDSMLGVAAVGMQPLLHSRAMEGWAPVLASSSHANNAKAVQLAQLHVSVSLDEIGVAHSKPNMDTSPLPSPSNNGVEEETAASSSDKNAHADNDRQFADRSDLHGEQAHTNGEATNESGRQIKQKHFNMQEERGRRNDDATTDTQGQHDYNNSLQNAEAAHSTQQPVQGNLDVVRSSKEYETAWQLEEWKRREKERFEEELKHKEASRMTALEEAWRQAEASRADEHMQVLNGLREEHGKLSSKLQKVEAREKELVQQHSKVSQERESEKRDAAAKLNEAQEAVRRVQAESEHKLEMERERSSELEKQRKREEQRADAAERRKEQAVSELEQFRRSARQEPEAVLQSELAKEREARERAEHKAARMQKARDKHKEQVQRLARELAALGGKTSNGQSVLSGLQQLKLSTSQQQQERQPLEGEYEGECALDQQGVHDDKLGRHHADGDAEEDQEEEEGLKERRGEREANDQGDFSSKDRVANERQPWMRRRGQGGSHKEKHESSAKVAEANGTSNTTKQLKASEEVQKEVRRLLRERAELIATGVYTRSDEVVAQMDSKIAQLLRSAGLEEAAGSLGG